MIVQDTLGDLVRLLDRKGIAKACGLVAMLTASGALEIVGIFFLFGYIAALGGGTTVQAGSPFIARLFDAVAGNFHGAGFAFVAGLLMVGVFALKNALWLLSSFALLRFAMKRYEHVAVALFDGFQEMPIDLMRVRGTLEPVQVLNSVTAVFRNAFTPLLQAAADAFIVLAMLLALMLATEPTLVLAAAVVLGLTAALLLLVTRRLSADLSTRLLNAERSLFRVTGEALRGLLEIRLAGRQDVMRQRFAEVAGEFGLANRRLRALDMLPRAMNEMVLAAGIALAATWFATREGGLAGMLPTLAVLGFAGLRVTAALSRILQSIQSMANAAPARERLMRTIERASPQLLRGHAGPRETYRQVDLPLPAGASPTLTSEIRLENVSFAYPGSDIPAVRQVSLDIPAGSFTAFCGPSGSGKSTIALLTMGLLQPQEGRVLCDGWDTHRHPSAWHRQIGHVGQTPFMAARSVRENVALGVRPEDIDDDAVWRALETAAVADLFRAHPDGLETVLGEDGTLLSGGQRQRVAIARALYHDPAVLVFDEATAALDTATEREVSAAIARLRGSRTVIAIAHRLSTIETADRIYLVEDGTIGASGTYGELRAQSEGFRKLAGAR